MSDTRKIIILVGIIPPYTCDDEYSDKMLEYYILKAKDSMPDLKWEIQEIHDNKVEKLDKYQ